METTTLHIEHLQADGIGERVRSALSGEPGVARVLLREDRDAVYVRHSRAKMPRTRLLERLREEGITAEILSR